MPILWDTLLATSVARELASTLSGTEARALFLDRGGRRGGLFLDEATLLFRLHPEEGELLLEEPREPLEEADSLRARFLGARSDPDERVMVLELQRKRGNQERLNLTLELMSNQWNALLVDVGSRRILRVLRPREAGERRLARDAGYAFPPPSDREGKEEPIPLERWMELLEGVEPGKRRGALLRTVAYTSSLNAPALLGRATEEDGPGAREDLESGYRLWRKLQGLEDLRPCLLQTPRGAQPYPYVLPGMEVEETSTLMEAMARATAQGEAPGSVLMPSSLLERLQRSVHRARGKLEQLRKELDEAPDPASLRAVGDLLLARFREVPRGEERAVLDDFQGEEVEVELDPTLSPQENAARYYDEAARAERARERLPGLMTEARERADRLETALAAARAGDLDPEEVRELVPEPAGGGGKGGGEERLPYRRYRSSGGLEIRVGRGAKSNDALTFHHSSPEDVWMHARHVAGAHVILRWQDEGNPPARDLAEAAVLAALSSKARGSGSVPVDWTRRKYVRSPRKSPPGVVVPDRVKTVFVEPDPELEKRLRVEE